jgi:hypothetical protein
MSDKKIFTLDKGRELLTTHCTFWLNVDGYICGKTFCAPPEHFTELMPYIERAITTGRFDKPRRGVEESPPCP